MQLRKSDLVKVLCLKCLKRKNPSCTSCLGNSYYYWDPVAAIYLDNKLNPLVVIQNPGNQDSAEIRDPAILMEFIHNWTMQHPARKWELIADENGWHATLCINKFKKISFECGGQNLHECLSSTFSRIMESECK